MFVGRRVGQLRDDGDQIDTQRAQQMLRRHAQLAHVLPTSTFQQEHLTRARSLPLKSLDATAATQFDRAKQLIVYYFDRR